MCVVKIKMMTEVTGLLLVYIEHPYIEVYVCIQDQIQDWLSD